MCLVNIDCKILELSLSNMEILLDYLKEWKLGKCIICFFEIFSWVLDDLLMYILCEFMYEMVIFFIEFYDSCYCVEKDCKIGEIIKVDMGWMLFLEVIVCVMEIVFYILGIKFVMKMWIRVKYMLLNGFCIEIVVCFFVLFYLFLCFVFSFFEL